MKIYSLKHKKQFLNYLIYINLVNYINMKKKLVGFLVLLSSSLFSQTTTVENPNFLNQIQGTWVDQEPGVLLWAKFVIKGNQITHYSARPREGQWPSPDYINQIINCYKQTSTERSDYDGKLKTQVVSYATHPPLNRNLYYGEKNGRKYIYEVNNEPTLERASDLLSESYWTSRKYYKVVSNYDPWK